MNSMAYNCGYCGKPGVAQYDPEFVKNAEFWKSKLHCNRCADYRTAISRLRERVKHAAALWYQAGLREKQTDALRKEVREKLEGLTRQITHLTAKQWSTEDNWGPEFALGIMDKGEHSEFIVNHYVASIKRQAQRSSQEVMI